MCNSIIVSTTSGQNLSALPTDLFQFRPPTEDDQTFARQYLKYPHIWYLSGRDGGCSCHFRHLLAESSDLGFRGPEEWWDEDTDEVESTQAVYDTFKSLVESNERVDLINAWNDKMTENWQSIEISLTVVTRESFRFFENFRFEINP